MDKTNLKSNNEPIDISSDESSNNDITINSKSKQRSSEAQAMSSSEGQSTSSEPGSIIDTSPPSLSLKRRRGRPDFDNPDSDFIDLAHFTVINLNSVDSSDSSHSGMTYMPTIRPEKRKYKKVVRSTRPREDFLDVGGMESVLRTLCAMLIHTRQPDVYFMLGVIPPRGMLLHGPSGCGKTHLAHAIAGQVCLPMIEVTAKELIGNTAHESQQIIGDIFDQAIVCAPCILFIDDIDAIYSNRSIAQRTMVRCMHIQLVRSLDALKLTISGQAILVIGATTRPDVLDPTLRQAGRFDFDVPVGIPNRNGRQEILTIICDGLSVTIHPEIDLNEIAALTPGYVGADIMALASCARTIAIKRKLTQKIRKLQGKSPKNQADKGQTEEKAGSPNIKQKSSAPGVTVAGHKASIATTSTAEMEIEPSTESSASKECNSATETATMGSTNEPQRMDVEEVDSTTKDTSEKASVVNEEPIDVDELPDESEPTLFDSIKIMGNASVNEQDISDICITMEDFKEVLKTVQPSAKREGFSTNPDVTWDDIGSLQDIQEDLKLFFLAPLKYPKVIEKLGLTMPMGVLLHGPPGCGKTLLAKAIANESGLNFLSVKGPEIISMHVGESGRAVKACFDRARSSAPCVIFFDKFESLCPKRTVNNINESRCRIFSQLLAEMDGVEERKGVYILAATNRIDTIDPAILRPGRLDKIIYVGPPEMKDREEILIALTKNRTKPILHEDVNFADLAAKTDGYTGADLARLVQQAAVLALNESTNNPNIKFEEIFVTANHFEIALAFLQLSVNAEHRNMNENRQE